MKGNSTRFARKSLENRPITQSQMSTSLKNRSSGGASSSFNSSNPTSSNVLIANNGDDSNVGDKGPTCNSEKDTVVIKRDLLVTDLLLRLHKRSSKLVDTHVICQDGYIPVHRHVLMACSKLLMKLLISEDPGELASVCLPDYKICQVLPLLSSFYSGCTVFEKSELNSVIEIITLLQADINITYSFQPARGPDQKWTPKMRYYVEGRGHLPQHQEGSSDRPNRNQSQSGDSSVNSSFSSAQMAIRVSNVRGGYNIGKESHSSKSHSYSCIDGSLEEDEDCNGGEHPHGENSTIEVDIEENDDPNESHINGMDSHFDDGNDMASEDELEIVEIVTDDQGSDSPGHGGQNENGIRASTPLENSYQNSPNPYDDDAVFSPTIDLVNNVIVRPDIHELANRQDDMEDAEERDPLELESLVYDEHFEAECSTQPAYPERSSFDVETVETITFDEQGQHKQIAQIITEPLSWRSTPAATTVSEFISRDNLSSSNTFKSPKSPKKLSPKSFKSRSRGGFNNSSSSPPHQRQTRHHAAELKRLEQLRVDSEHVKTNQRLMTSRRRRSIDKSDQFEEEVRNRKEDIRFVNRLYESFLSELLPAEQCANQEPSSVAVVALPGVRQADSSHIYDFNDSEDKDRITLNSTREAKNLTAKSKEIEELHHTDAKKRKEEIEKQKLVAAEEERLKQLHQVEEQLRIEQQIEKQRKLDEKRQKIEEQRRKKLDAEKQKKLAEEERHKLEQENKQKLEEAKRLKVEAEKLKKQEEKQAKLESEKSRRLEEENLRKSEEKRQKDEVEKLRKLDEEKRKKLEAEKHKKLEEEKIQKETEKLKKVEEEKRQKAEAEKLNIVEEEKRQKAEAEKLKKLEEEKHEKLATEKRQNHEEEKRRKHEEANRQKCEEERDYKLRKEEEKRKKLEKEKQIKLDKVRKIEEEKRLQIEKAEQRKAEEENRRLKLEEQKRLEAEKILREQQEAEQRQREEETRLKLEAERLVQEEEARKKEEEQKAAEAAKKELERIEEAKRVEDELSLQIERDMQKSNRDFDSAVNTDNNSSSSSDTTFFNQEQLKRPPKSTKFYEEFVEKKRKLLEAEKKKQELLAILQDDQSKDRSSPTLSMTASDQSKSSVDNSSSNSNEEAPVKANEMQQSIITSKMCHVNATSTSLDVFASIAADEPAMEAVEEIEISSDGQTTLATPMSKINVPSVDSAPPSRHDEADAVPKAAHDEPQPEVEPKVVENDQQAMDSVFTGAAVAHPSDLVDPADCVDRIDPSDRVVPIDRVDPADRVEPADRVDPSDHVDPSAPDPASVVYEIVEDIPVAENEEVILTDDFGFSTEIETVVENEVEVETEVLDHDHGIDHVTECVDFQEEVEVGGAIEPDAPKTPLNTDPEIEKSTNDEAEVAGKATPSSDLHVRASEDEPKEEAKENENKVECSGSVVENSISTAPTQIINLNSIQITVNEDVSPDLENEEKEAESFSEAATTDDTNSSATTTAESALSKAHRRSRKKRGKKVREKQTQTPPRSIASTSNAKTAQLTVSLQKLPSNHPDSVIVHTDEVEKPEKFRIVTTRNSTVIEKSKSESGSGSDGCGPKSGVQLLSLSAAARALSRHPKRIFTTKIHGKHYDLSNPKVVVNRMSKHFIKKNLRRNSRQSSPSPPLLTPANTKDVKRDGSETWAIISSDIKSLNLNSRDWKSSSSVFKSSQFSKHGKNSVHGSSGRRMSLGHSQNQDQNHRKLQHSQSFDALDRSAPPLLSPQLLSSSSKGKRGSAPVAAVTPVAISNFPAVSQPAYITYNDLDWYQQELKRCAHCKHQYKVHTKATTCLMNHGFRRCLICLDLMSNLDASYEQHYLKFHSVRHQKGHVACPICGKILLIRGLSLHVTKKHLQQPIDSHQYDISYQVPKSKQQKQQQQQQQPQQVQQPQVPFYGANPTDSTPFFGQQSYHSPVEPYPAYSQHPSTIYNSQGQIDQSQPVAHDQNLGTPGGISVGSSIGLGTGAGSQSIAASLNKLIRHHSVQLSEESDDEDEGVSTEPPSTEEEDYRHDGNMKGNYKTSMRSSGNSPNSVSVLKENSVNESAKDDRNGNNGDLNIAIQALSKGFRPSEREVLSAPIIDEEMARRAYDNASMDQQNGSGNLNSSVNSNLSPNPNQLQSMSPSQNQNHQSLNVQHGSPEAIQFHGQAPPQASVLSQTSDITVSQLHIERTPLLASEQQQQQQQHETQQQQQQQQHHLHQHQQHPHHNLHSSSHPYGHLGHPHQPPHLQQGQSLKRPLFPPYQSDIVQPKKRLIHQYTEPNYEYGRKHMSAFPEHGNHIPPYFPMMPPPAHFSHPDHHPNFMHGRQSHSILHPHGFPPPPPSHHQHHSHHGSHSIHHSQSLGHGHGHGHSQLSSHHGHGHGGHHNQSQSQGQHHGGHPQHHDPSNNDFPIINPNITVDAHGSLLCELSPVNYAASPIPVHHYNSNGPKAIQALSQEMYAGGNKSSSNSSPIPRPSKSMFATPPLQMTGISIANLVDGGVGSEDGGGSSNNSGSSSLFDSIIMEENEEQTRRQHLQGLWEQEEAQGGRGNNGNGSVGGNGEGDSSRGGGTNRSGGVNNMNMDYVRMNSLESLEESFHCERCNENFYCSRLLEDHICRYDNV